MPTKPKLGFGCKAVPKTGAVQIFFMENGKPLTRGLVANPSFVSAVIALLLSESIKASRTVKPQRKKTDMIPYIRGISFGLSQDQSAGTIDLRVHAGNAEFCIPMKNDQAAALARTILTAAETAGRA